MPSTTDYLHNKFMSQGDDGIDEAEQIILKYGGTVNIPSIGLIKVPDLMENRYDIESTDMYSEFWDAVQFLCEEWDYSHTNTTLNSTSKSMELLQAFVLFKEKGAQKLYAVYPEHASFVLEHSKLTYKEFKNLLENL
jgi:hypothetical protein